MWKQWKKISCSMLIVALILAELPMSAMAVSNTASSENGTRVFGDADGDGELSAKDIEIILRYIVEDNPSGPNTSGFRLCGPSHSPWAGSLCTSTWSPSAPAATAPKARGSTSQYLPVAWLGSMMMGRWVSLRMTGMAARSRVLRV